jgi:Glu-tRNA(Gln) amidotransferase subunit E-like FAD-binding protein
VTKQIVDNVKALVPRPYWEEEGEMVQFGVPSKVAHRLVVSEWRDTFRKAVAEGAQPRFSSILLMEDMKALERSGTDIHKLTDEDMVNVLKMVEEGEITRKAAPVVLSWMADADVDASGAINELDLSMERRTH